MIFRRLGKLFTKPIREIFSRLAPEKYARRIGVNIGRNPHFYGKIDWGTEPWIITIGDNAHITYGCKFVAHDGGTLIFRDKIPDLEITKPITIGNNVYIGTESLILPGVNIGSNVVIGARSVVTRDIPDNSVAAGVPCRVIKTTEEYLEKLKKESLHLGHLRERKRIKHYVRTMDILREDRLKKVLCCVRMPHGTYCGGVATMVKSYIAKKDTFGQCGIDLALFDFIAPKICAMMPSKISNVLYGLLQRRAIINRLRSDDVAAVHIHTSCRFLYLKDIWLARAIKRKRSIPVYLTIHVGAAETVFQRIGFTGNTTIRWINRYVDQVIFLSDHIREEFIQLGMKPERGVTLGNFHDLSVVPDGQNLPKKAKLHLLFVGSIHRDKGILELLTALINLPELDFHLDICGTVTNQSIQSELDRLLSVLADKVQVHGYVKGQEKAALFHRADVLLLPSYHEGFPLVILEALAGGCAIISTKVGATPEVLDERNALWVSVGSSEDIQSAIVKISEDKPFLEAMKQENRKLSEDFSIESHIQKLCHIYDI